MLCGAKERIAHNLVVTARQIFHQLRFCARLYCNVFQLLRIFHIGSGKDRYDLRLCIFMPRNPSEIEIQQSDSVSLDLPFRNLFILNHATRVIVGIEADANGVPDQLLADLIQPVV